MKTINEIDVNNKAVVVRCDYNVPIENGVIQDNSRIVKSLKTINYLLEHNAKVIILSHLGRVKTEEDRVKYSLRVVAQELGKLINKKVEFIPSCYGNEVKEKTTNLSLGEVALLENTRFMDYPDKLESGNDPKLAEFWASLGDVFILDAFGSCHRAHASTAGIAKYIPSAIGFLVESELQHLNTLIDIKERPFTIFMGGAKVEDKLPIIKKLLPKCDYLLLGGGIANSFLKASGMDVKNSLATEDESLLQELKNMLDNNKDKIVLPVDFVIDNDSIFDLGVNSIDKFTTYIEKSNLCFINGTPGLSEDDRFAEGTKSLLKYLASYHGKVIAGGGDTVSAIKRFGFEGKFYFESSGGGATLEYIADGELEALKWLK